MAKKEIHSHTHTHVADTVAVAVISYQARGAIN